SGCPLRWPVLPCCSAAPLASRGARASPCGPRCSAATIRGRSAMGSRNVPVQVPPCQMLNTATPVSAYQLSPMLRDSPLTSKYTSPSRGNAAASYADMLPIVTLDPRLCPVGDPLSATDDTALAVGACLILSPGCGTVMTDGTIERRFGWT